MIIRFVSLLFMAVTVVQAADRIPTAEDVEDYNDPVLREVFQSSKNIRTNSQYYGQPEPLPQGVPAKQTSVPRNQGRVPGTPSGVQTSRYQLNGYQPAPTAYTNNVNNGYQPYQPSPPPQTTYSNQNYYGQSPFEQLAMQGAQGFINGAQAVGQVFGIRPSYSSYNSGYEVPAQGGFFG